MTVLSKDEILKEIKKKRIKVEPFDEKCLGPSSLDLKLGDEFRVLNEGITVDIKEETDYLKYSKPVKVKDYFVLEPNKLILGITKEKITLPENICGSLSGRSRFARLGLLVHITASFVQPGISNKQVLEIKNASQFTMKLFPGTRICQLRFERMEGKAKYTGRFKKQERL